MGVYDVHGVHSDDRVCAVREPRELVVDAVEVIVGASYLCLEIQRVDG